MIRMNECAALAVGALLLFAGCSGQPSSADHSVAAALLGGGDANATSAATLAGSSGLAGQVATQAVSQQVSFVHLNKPLQRHAREIMYARLREGIRARKPGSFTGVIPTAFACADGTCNLNASETLTGSQSCSNGGSITAQNVPLTQSGSSSVSGGVFNVNTTTTMNGSFLFSACQTLGLDYNDLSSVKYENVTIDGTITVNGTNTNVSNGSFSCTTSGTTSCTSSGTGSYTANAQVTSQALSVNGGTAAVVSVTDTSSFSTSDSLSYSFDSSGTLTSFSGTITLNGTLKISGTVDGTDVSLDETISNQTLTCDLNGCL